MNGNIDTTVLTTEETDTSTPLTSAATATAAAVEFARLIGRLKTTPRTGWVRRGVPRYESVADHSWRVAALSFLLLNSNDNNNDHSSLILEKKGIDKDIENITCTDQNNQDNTIIDVTKCIQLAIIHDIAECIVGDIAPDDNVTAADKSCREDLAMKQLTSILQTALLSETKNNNTVSCQQQQHQHDSTRLFTDLFHEYESRQTKESLAVKDLDLLDMILQADEYEERFNIDLSDFFQGTPTSRFHTPRLRQIAQEVHHQRTDRRRNNHHQQQSTNTTTDNLKLLNGNKGNDSNISLSFNDKAFIEEYSKASKSSAESIENILLAYKQWNS
jgi:putative hydrolases of HD superfamily